MKIDIAFVILHYMTFEDTDECIRSIKENIDTEQYAIIVVDNNSNNGSYEALRDLYSSDERIVLLHNDDNLGFAKGNNAGIFYCKEYFDADYICVLNNDIILQEKDLLEKISEVDKRTGFAVLGPHITTSDGNTKTNPVALKPNSIKKCKAKILLFRIKYAFSLLNLDEFIFKTLLAKKLEKMNAGCEKGDDWETTEKTGIKLHGAFWIFSKKYFEKFDGLDPVTFLYSEEEILYTHILENNLTSVYSPNIYVYHKEDSSTDAMHGKTVKRRRFVYKWSIDSLKKCIAVKEKYAGK